jgi:hypothetical protein
MREIKQIINDAGGAAAIARASGGAFKIDAVYKWPEIGIPDRHWPLIIKLAESAPEELYAANVSARSPSTKETV